MTKPKLSPCPDCGGECYFHKGMGVLMCYRCEYCRYGEKMEQIIAKHERLAGVCEWIEEDDDDSWQSSCGAEWMNGLLAQSSSALAAEGQ